MRHRSKLAILSLLFIPTPGRADQELANQAYIAVAGSGTCYAKSVPKHLRGQEGQTRIYLVEKGEDLLLETHDWFSKGIYLSCHVQGAEGPAGVSVVRLGHWPEGKTATEADLAVAFYFRGRLVAEYSTLDLAGHRDNVEATISHYSVIKSISGYSYLANEKMVFKLGLIDGRELAFDPTTGRIVK